MEIEKLEIAKLELKDGDVLAVIYRGGHATQHDMAELRYGLDVILHPIGVKTFVFNGDFELKVIRKTEEFTDATLCH